MKEDEVENWIGVHIRCAGCFYEWGALHPNCDRLECPECGNWMNVDHYRLKNFEESLEEQIEFIE